MEADHREVVELMPWYVNGSLTARERAGIEKHVKECLPCRAALRDEQRIRGLVSAQDDMPVGVGHGVSDLLRKIDGSGTRTTPLWLRPQLGLGAAVVCVAVAGWLVLTSTAPDANAPAADASSAPFATLTDGAGVAANRIDIVFADGVTDAEIRALIESVDARLIGGPSEVGRYTVAVAPASDAELSALIDRLAQDPRVRFAGRSYSALPSPAPDSR
ncbi:MAG TPA: zf-HC2 domain-containing protein [Gammaproteobacteria bacterium]|nr:zf-HC2 domain-containing protein [Gammaproteobacteria bacterium]